MTVRGYCPRCERLVRIAPVGWKKCGRQQAWEVQPHETDSGAICEGTGERL